MGRPLQELSEQGVAVWVDSIARDWIDKGELRRLRDEMSVVGVTSNPTIFEAAMGSGSFYDDQLAELAEEGLDAPKIFEHMALEDIGRAAEELRDVYDSTDGRDGCVSYEVAPELARDTEQTAAEAVRLFDEIGRPNVLIKIPATAEGLPAIQRSIAKGINVNVTLIFSLERYRQVVEAYLSGLEQRHKAGQDISRVTSVASFFVSRVDSLVDPRLEEIVQAGGPSSKLAQTRLGTTAIDNAKLAYQAWGELHSGPRWEALAEAGAQPQRCLWASTSTKNPDYRDVVYVEELVGRDTVNTMPLSTIEAYADHGETRGQTVTEDLERAQRLWPELERLGISEAQIGRQLEDEGVEKFAASYRQALDAVEAKRRSATA